MGEGEQDVSRMEVGMWVVARMQKGFGCGRKGWRVLVVPSSWVSALQLSCFLLDSWDKMLGGANSSDCCPL